MRHKGKKRRKSSATAGRGFIPGRVGIEERPLCVEKKDKVMHWEGDTMVGAHHKGVLVTHVERCSKYLIIGHANNRTKEAVTIETIKGFQKVAAYAKKKFIGTITYDNGKEFADHAKIAAALNAKRSLLFLAKRSE